MFAKEQLVRDMKALGLQKGARVIIHSSCQSLGEVEGGADTVIEALMETVTDRGLLVFPIFNFSGPYDFRGMPSGMGILSERFRQRPDTVKSRHPTHSVAAWGEGAESLVAGHLDSPTACGKNTPFGKIVDQDGSILLLGVDHDRNTLLHTAEEYANAPYLSTLVRPYVDEHGCRQEKTLHRFPGPHRDFIGLDNRLSRAGIQRIGKVGNAICRLMKANDLVDFVVDLLRRDPAAVLCSNPECRDCVMQRGRIRRAFLSQKSWKLSATADSVSPWLDEALEWTHDLGIDFLELGRVNRQWLTQMPDNGIEQVRAQMAASPVSVSCIAARNTDRLEKTFELAKQFQCNRVCLPLNVGSASQIDRIAALAVRNDCTVYLENGSDASSDVFGFFAARKPEKAIALAVNPSHFVKMGEAPFLTACTTNRLVKYAGHWYLNDATWEGAPARLTRGNAEIKELVSMLQCRNFAGFLTIKHDLEKTRRELETFLQGLDQLLGQIGGCIPKPEPAAACAGYEGTETIEKDGLRPVLAAY